MAVSSGARSSGLCSPRCRYRVLYEGSEQSLRSLSEQHTKELARYEKFRHGMLVLLRKRFPREIRSFERGMGQGVLEDLSDRDLFQLCEQLLSPAGGVSTPEPPPPPNLPAAGLFPGSPQPPSPPVPVVPSVSEQVPQPRVGEVLKNDHLKIPKNRPCFVSGLKARYGEGRVDNWLDRQLSEEGSPFRVLAAPARHQADYGDLIIPPEAGSVSGLWGEVAHRFDGGELFEWAVFAANYGSVTGVHRFGSEVAELSVTLDTGLVSVLVCSVSSPARVKETVAADLFNMVVGAVAERVTTVFVLTTTNNLVEPLVTGLRHHADMVGWVSPTYVAVTPMWKFVEDQGATSQLVWEPR